MLSRDCKTAGVEIARVFPGEMELGVLCVCLRDRALLFSGGSLPRAKSGWDACVSCFSLASADWVSQVE